MNKYEAMFILKSDLADEEKKTLFNQLAEGVSKNNGSVSNVSVWAERKRLLFPIGKHHEGLYYLMNFTAPAAAIQHLRQAYKLNENILRVLITRM